MIAKRPTYKRIFRTAIGLSVCFLTACNSNESDAPMTREDSVWRKKRLEEVMKQDSLKMTTGFSSQITNNKTIVDWTITDVGVLYLSVVNDGIDKNQMATYYCRLAKENSRDDIKSVKVVDASTYNKGPGYASGKELGKSFCN